MVDGGLGGARSAINAARLEAQQRTDSELAQINAALVKQDERVSQALDAFFAAVREEGVDPDQAFYDSRVVKPRGPKVLGVQFGQKYADVEKLYEPVFILHAWTDEIDSVTCDGQTLLLYPDARLKILRHRPGWSSLDLDPGWKLGFHALDFRPVKLDEGPCLGPHSAFSLRMESIRFTTDWFVGTLAARLERQQGIHLDGRPVGSK